MSSSTTKLRDKAAQEKPSTPETSQPTRTLRSTNILPHCAEHRFTSSDQARLFLADKGYLPVDGPTSLEAIAFSLRLLATHCPNAIFQESVLAASILLSEDTLPTF